MITVDALDHALVHALVDALQVVRALVHDLVYVAGQAIPSRVKLINDFGEIITLLGKEEERHKEGRDLT